MISLSDKNIYWKSLTPYEKHIALMYVYRLKTENSKHLELYFVEPHEFRRLKIRQDFLPDFIFTMKEELLKKDAMYVIR